MSKGQNRKARRAPVRKAYQQAVDAAAKEKSKQWLESHPPRVEVPVITGRWRHPDVLRQENAYEVQFGPKPEYPVMQVPLMQHHPFLRLNERANSQYDVVSMRAVEWGVTFGATRVRWWNWEPTRCDGMFENEAAVYRAAHVAHAMMEALEPTVSELAEMDPWGRRFDWSQPGSRHPLPPDVALRYWREATDLLGQWLGMVKTRYFLPGKNGEPIEQANTARAER